MKFFAAPAYLWAIPVILLVFPIAWLVFERGRRRSLAAFASEATLSTIAPARRTAALWAGRGLLVAAALLTAVAAARPQWGESENVFRREGLDIVFVLDTSASMDAGESDSRLAVAKRAIVDLVDLLRGDRVGLVAFAGDAQVLCPLTIDYAAIRLFLDGADTSLLSAVGSDVGQGVRRALTLFRREERKFKVIIVVSDGEDHIGQALAAAREATAQGAVLHAVGVGNPAGEPIPVRDNRGTIIGHKKDRDGRVVSTRLEESSLESLSTAAGGVYVPARAGERGLARLADAVSKMERREVDSKVGSRLQDQFEWPLLLAFALLLVELALARLVPAPRAVALNGVPEVTGPGRKRAKGVAALLVLSMAPGARAERAVDEGVKAFEEGRSEDAVAHFQKALEKDPESPVLRYDLGTALLAAGRTGEAVGELERAARGGSVDLRARAHYNIGNALYAAGEREKALHHFREALRLQPPDDDSKHNYEVVQSELKQQPPPTPSPSPSPSPNPAASPSPTPEGGPSPTPGEDGQESGEGQPSPDPEASPTPGPGEGEVEKSDAERLLDALAERESAERADRKKPKAAGERPPLKDW